MTKIPIPFIGGSEGPRRGRGDREGLDPPFYPGGAEGEAQTAQRPQPEPDPQRPDLEEQAEPTTGTADAGADDLDSDAADVPDWLLGSESETEGQASAESEGPHDANAESEDLTVLGQVADQLMTGTHADWLRTLIANLSPYDTEIAVPRAFAAGYLTGKAEEEAE